MAELPLDTNNLVDCLTAYQPAIDDVGLGRCMHQRDLLEGVGDPRFRKKVPVMYACV